LNLKKRVLDSNSLVCQPSVNELDLGVLVGSLVLLKKNLKKNKTVSGVYHPSFFEKKQKRKGGLGQG
jgi:hypothetical protein